MFGSLFRFHLECFLNREPHQCLGHLLGYVVDSPTCSVLQSLCCWCVCGFDRSSFVFNDLLQISFYFV